MSPAMQNQLEPIGSNNMYSTKHQHQCRIHKSASHTTAVRPNEIKAHQHTPAHHTVILGSQQAAHDAKTWYQKNSKSKHIATCQGKELWCICDIADDEILADMLDNVVLPVARCSYVTCWRFTQKRSTGATPNLGSAFSRLTAFS